MSNQIVSDVQQLAMGQEVDLYVLDLTYIGSATVLYFHPGVNGLGSNVTWQGQVYTKWPVEATGYEMSGRGTLPRPKLTVANIDGSISALCALYQDMAGAQITRHRTLLKYLDAVNFPGGVNASADPTSHYNDEVYIISRKTNQNPIFVEFELTCRLEVTGQKIPNRQCIQNSCSWAYRGTECGYTGASYFDTNDNSVGSLSLDVCGKRVSSCEKRFPPPAGLPFGGFPGVTT